MAARSKACFCGCMFSGIVGSDPAGGVDVCCECFVLLGIGLCVRLITLPEVSCRVFCAECDREASVIRRLQPNGGAVGLWGKYNTFKVVKCGAGR